MYAVQAVFNSKRLDPKLSDIYIFTNRNDVIEYIKKLKNKIEVDVSTNQTPEIKKEIALHWAKKGNSNKEQSDALLNYIKDNDYALPFTFLKISQFNEKGNIGKLKNAVLINNQIYYIKNIKENIYQTVTKKVL